MSGRGDDDMTSYGAAQPARPIRRAGRHPLLQDWPQGEWCPAVVGKVRGYPRTEATFLQRRALLRANRERAMEAGRLTRQGVPNGWAGRRDEIAEVRRNSRTEAEMLTEDFMVRGISKVPTTWSPRFVCGR